MSFFMSPVYGNSRTLKTWDRRCSEKGTINSARVFNLALTLVYFPRVSLDLGGFLCSKFRTNA